MISTENRRKASVRAGAAFVSFLAVVSVQPAAAYVDPGTGSMLVQMMVAGIAGAMFYFRELRLQFTNWIRRVVHGRTQSDSMPSEAVEKPAQRSDA